MFFVYFLKSSLNNDLYVGSTENVENRVKLHNSGKVKSTKGYRPWIFLGKEEFPTRGEAVQRERFLKSHQQKDLLKIKYGLVEKW